MSNVGPRSVSDFSANPQENLYKLQKLLENIKLTAFNVSENSNTCTPQKAKTFLSTPNSDAISSTSSKLDLLKGDNTQETESNLTSSTQPIEAQIDMANKTPQPPIAFTKNEIKTLTELDIPGSPVSNSEVPVVSDSSQKPGDAGIAKDTQVTSPQEAGTEAKQKKNVLKSPTSSKKQQLFTKIETLDSYGSNVYIGTTDGQIFRYTLSDLVYNSEDGLSHKQLERVTVGSGGKKIEQLFVLSSLSIIVCLCDSTVFWYGLPTLEPLNYTTAPIINGVSCISVDQLYIWNNNHSSAGTVSVCIAKKKLLQVYQVGKSVILEKEIPLEYGAVTICHSGRYVCMADIKVHRILDLDSRDRSLELVPVVSTYKDPVSGESVRPPRPKVMVIGPQEFLFLVLSSQEASCLGVIVSETGEARRSTLQFSEPPKSIVSSEPNLFALFSDGRIEVHNTYGTDETLVQSMNISKARKPRKLTYTNPIQINAFNPGEFDFGDNVYSPVVNLNQASTYQNKNKSYNYRKSHSAESLSNCYFENMVILFNSSVDILTKPSTFIKVRKLLDEKRVEEAMDITERIVESNGASMLQSLEVQYLYQRAALVFFGYLLFGDAIEYLEKGKFDPRAVLYLYNNVKKHLGSLLPPLKEINIHHDIQSTLEEMQNISTLAEKASEQFTDQSRNQTSAVLKSYLDNANNLLIKYLKDVENQYSDRGILVIINTSLLILYAGTNKTSRLEKLISQKHKFVNSNIAISYLLSQEKYYYTSLLYKYQGKSDEYLDLYDNIISGKLVDPEFTGEPEYIEYLTNLKNEQIMVTKFYKMLDINVGMAVNIFVLISPGTVAGLNTDSLINKIGTSMDDDVLRRFIERLIVVHHSKSPLYATLLAQIYVRDIQRWFLLEDPDETKDTSYRRIELESAFQARKNQDITLTFRHFLSQMIAEEKILKRAENQNSKSPKERDVRGQGRLLKNSGFFCDFLRQTMSEDYFESIKIRHRFLMLITELNQQFDIAKVIETISKHANDYLTLEHAVLLLKLGEVRKAVSILVHEAKEFTEAELICLNPKSSQSLFKLVPPVQSSESKPPNNSKVVSNGNQSVFITKDTPANIYSQALEKQSADNECSYNIVLFQEYLKIEDPEMSYLLVSNLLKKYTDRYTVEQILSLIPQGWLILPFVPYLKTNYEALSAQREFSLVTTNLLAPMIREVQKKYYHAQSLPSSGEEFIKAVTSKKGNTLDVLSKARADILSYYKTSLRNIKPDYTSDLNETSFSTETGSDKVKIHKDIETPAEYDTALNTVINSMRKKIDCSSNPSVDSLPYTIIHQQSTCIKCGGNLADTQPFAYFPSTKSYSHLACLEK